MESTGIKLVGALIILALASFFVFNSSHSPLAQQINLPSPQELVLPTLAPTVQAPAVINQIEPTPTRVKPAEDKQESVAKLNPTNTPFPTPTVPSTPVATATEAAPTVEVIPTEIPLIPAGEDGKLVIPKVDLSSEIVKVPIIDNQWQVEDLGAAVGLLEGGGRFPGDEKSMILAGHATTFWPVKGPFAKLAGLIPDDEIVYVFDGLEYTYKISRLVWAEPEDINILNSDNGDQIILVTCGKYDYFVGRYDERLVVLADLINVQPTQAN